jgi:hypothetical protein
MCLGNNNFWYRKMFKYKLIKNTYFFVIAIFIIGFIPTIGFAANVSELREDIQAVREKLVVLLVTTDNLKQAVRIEDVKQLSQDIDVKLKMLLEDDKTSEDLKKKLTEFQSVWNTFRATRDTEIIPRILSGEDTKIKEAKTIARTTQAELFQKMQSLLQ